MENQDYYKSEFRKYLVSDLGNAAWTFDQKNQHVYKMFTGFARQVLHKGHERFGVGAIWERMRWELSFTTEDSEPFKISNNHRAYYARKLMAESKAFEGFFKISLPRGL